MRICQRKALKKFQLQLSLPTTAGNQRIPRRGDLKVPSGKKYRIIINR